METAQQVQGRVVDEHGQPLAGVAVGSYDRREFVDSAALLASPSVTTDSEGRYAIATVAWQRWLVFAKADRQAGCLRTGWLGSGEVAHDDFVLPPGARLIGRIRDEAGKPLAGARIRVDSSLTDLTSSVLAGARSDADGEFVIPCVSPNCLRVLVEADGFLPATRLASAGTRLELSLRRGVLVTGCARHADGRPMAGADVEVVRAEAGEVLATVATADGSFALTIPERQRYRLVVRSAAEPWIGHRSPLLRGAQRDLLLGERADAPRLDRAPNRWPWSVSWLLRRNRRCDCASRRRRAMTNCASGDTSRTPSVILQ